MLHKYLERCLLAQSIGDINQPELPHIGEQISDDENFVIGATRDSCLLVIGIDTDSVDFMVTI